MADEQQNTGAPASTDPKASTGVPSTPPSTTPSTGPTPVGLNAKPGEPKDPFDAVKPADKPKGNKMMPVIVVFLLLLVGAGSFFAGRATAPQAPTPTPTPAAMEKKVPTAEPTEALSPTVAPSESVSPTTVQATPTTGAEAPTAVPAQ